MCFPADCFEDFKVVEAGCEVVNSVVTCCTSWLALAQGSTACSLWFIRKHGEVCRPKIKGIPVRIIGFQRNNTLLLFAQMPNAIHVALLTEKAL